MCLRIRAQTFRASDSIAMRNVKRSDLKILLLLPYGGILLNGPLNVSGLRAFATDGGVNSSGSIVSAFSL